MRSLHQIAPPISTKHPFILLVWKDPKIYVNQSWRFRFFDVLGFCRVSTLGVTHI